uniref:Uncharacterized protein n=1 Tax=Oryza rufipogon TaxID=4529 RepID=A0A0E0N9A3_ORYRU
MAPLGSRSPPMSSPWRAASDLGGGSHAPLRLLLPPPRRRRPPPPSLRFPPPKSTESHRRQPGLDDLSRMRSREDVDKNMAAWLYEDADYFVHSLVIRNARSRSERNMK